MWTRAISELAPEGARDEGMVAEEELPEGPASEAAGRVYEQLTPQKRHGESGVEVPDSKSSRTVAGLAVCQVEDLPVLDDPEMTLAALCPALQEEDENGTIIGSLASGITWG